MPRRSTAPKVAAAASRGHCLSSTPVILFNLVIGVIYSFQVFTQALVIGDTNGEPLESTLMFLVLIYRNAFRYFSMGYAAALCVVLFAAVRC